MQVTPLFENLAGVSAFSTHAGFNVEQAFLPATLPATSSIFLPVQTHSTRVITPDEDPQGADGVVARGRGKYIGVRTADCLPLLMVDPMAQVIAAVHCGWRGTVGGIAHRAVERMIDLGARPERIHAAMGPCICPACFEVGEEVAVLFSPSSRAGIPACDPPRRAGIPACDPSAKPHIDLAAEVVLQLRSHGITQIAPPPACSKCDRRFYSVRRQGRDLAERTITAIALL